MRDNCARNDAAESRDGATLWPNQGGLIKTREHRETRPRGELTEEIRHEAYLLWQQDGCPAGRELDHWLAAQELVRHRRHAPHAAGDDPRESEVRPTERLVTPN